MELCLGTVQFGMDYGIRGGKKPTHNEITQILDYAYDNGISLLDTALGYGDAQTIIGAYVVNHQGRFQIISKLSMDLFKNVDPRNYFLFACDDTETILKQLWVPSLKGLLLHNPSYLYDKPAIAALRRLKESGYTDLIGVSVYEPKDAEYALELGLDLIQLPINLFDRRFDNILELATDRSVKLFARSIFLQGLLLMEPEEVSRKLPASTEYIRTLDRLCKEYQVSRREVALSYVKQKSGINAIVIGIDELSQLKENVEAFHHTIPKEIVDEIAKHFEAVSDSIVSPLNWNIRIRQEAAGRLKDNNRAADWSSL